MEHWHVMVKIQLANNRIRVYFKLYQQVSLKNVLFDFCEIPRLFVEPRSSSVIIKSFLGNHKKQIPFIYKINFYNFRKVYKKLLSYPNLFALFFPAKPAPLRNCTLRPYLSSSSYPNSLNSTNSTVSSPPSPSNGPHSKELNYINTEYVKDRNVFVTAGKKTSGTLATTKFNQKNSGAGREIGGSNSNTTKNNRRNSNGANNVSEKGTNKKSYSPSATKRRSGSASGSNVNAADETGMGGGNNHQIGSSSTFTSKSISSYVSWKMDNQRIAKRQIAYQNIKHGINNKNAGQDDEEEKVEERDDAKENDELKINVVDNIIHTPMNSNGNMAKGNVDPKSSSAVAISSKSSENLAMETGNNNSQDGTGNDNRDNINNVPKRFVVNRRLGHEPQQQQQQPSLLSMVNHKKFHGHAINYDDEPKMAYLQSSDSTNLVGDDGMDAQRSHHSHRRRTNGNNGNNANNNVIVDTFDGPPPSTMELECVAGYDGGLPQYFVLEAYDSRTRKLRLNTTSAFSDVPLFRIDLAGMCMRAK